MMNLATQHRITALGPAKLKVVEKEDELMEAWLASDEQNTVLRNEMKQLKKEINRLKQLVGVVK
jgi:hypothetical protein